MFDLFQHHYSIKGGASAIGLGTENCVQVACDERSVDADDEVDVEINLHVKINLDVKIDVNVGVDC